MKIASVFAVSVVVAVGASVTTPAQADSNGVTVYCGIQGDAKVLIKAENKNAYPMKCNITCGVKNGKGESSEVKLSDKPVAGPDSTYQTLLDEDRSDGPYTPTGSLDYSCSQA